MKISSPKAINWTLKQYGYRPVLLGLKFYENSYYDKGLCFNIFLRAGERAGEHAGEHAGKRAGERAGEREGERV
jgi:hypothetical protein